MRLDDAGLYKISLGISTIGLILLYLISSTFQVDIVSISEIDYDMVGSIVSIEGKVVSKRVHEDGHIFFKVEEGTNRISAVVFSSEVKKLEPEVLKCLEEGNSITVTGRVEEYRGTLEVIPTKGDGLRCSTS